MYISRRFRRLQACVLNCSSTLYEYPWVISISSSTALHTARSADASSELAKYNYVKNIFMQNTSANRVLFILPTAKCVAPAVHALVIACEDNHIRTGNTDLIRTGGDSEIRHR